MNRILVLTEIYYPEQTSTGYLLTKTAEGLAETFAVTVITGPASNYGQNVSYPFHEIHKNVEIFRCSGSSFPKDILVGRLFNIISRSFTIMYKTLHACQRRDAILVVTNPPLLPFIALIVKWLTGCSVVLLIHDVYPDALVASGLVSSQSLLVRLGRWLNSILYSQAERIVSLGRDMTELIEEKFADASKKIHYIPNWAENDIIRPTKRTANPLLQELGISDKFVVLYAGNMGRTHGIECIAATAKALQSANVHFIMLGFGAKKEWLEEYIRNEKLENISVLKPRPREEQIVFLNACDVALISYVTGMAGVSVPSRLYNHLAAGKPIIAMADACSELVLVVREEGIGWVVEPGDVEGLKSAIEYAAKHQELCEEMGDNAARIASAKYTFERAKESYTDLFRDLFSKS